LTDTSDASEPMPASQNDHDSVIEREGHEFVRLNLHGSMHVFDPSIQFDQDALTRR